ncbi:hypothetical protein QOT17_010560 [Balamuthia mandrillaris]
MASVSALWEMAPTGLAIAAFLGSASITMPLADYVCQKYFDQPRFLTYDRDRHHVFWQERRDRIDQERSSLIFTHSIRHGRPIRWDADAGIYVTEPFQPASASSPSQKKHTKERAKAAATGLEDCEANDYLLRLCRTQTRDGALPIHFYSTDPKHRPPSPSPRRLRKIVGYQHPLEKSTLDPIKIPLFTVPVFMYRLIHPPGSNQHQVYPALPPKQEVDASSGHH